MSDIENLVKRGAIITLMGVPRSNEPGALDPIVQAITAMGQTAMINPEVGLLDNVACFTEANLREVGADLDDMSEAPFNSAAMRAAATAMTGGMALADYEEEIAEKKRWAALTPEQQEAETAARNAATQKRYEETYVKCVAERDQELAEIADNADGWIAKVEANQVSPAEAIYGVSRDFYLKHGLEKMPQRGSYKWDEHDRSASFAAVYDTRMAEKIGSRAARTAKALFGG